jgi:cystathionine gamma-lyase
MLPRETQDAVMRLLHHRTAGLAPGAPVAEPLVATSTYRLGEAPDEDALYGRYGGPNWTGAEGRLGALEGAEAILFGAGMGAIAGVMLALLRAGDRVVLPSDGYFHSRVLAGEVLAPLGVVAAEVATRDLARADLAGARLVMCETPSNPGLDLVDLPALARRARAAGARLVVDNTLPTALLQSPLDLGADVVVASDTKAPGGHSDLILGHAATRDADLAARIRAVRKFAGLVPGPFEAWMLSRSLETLELRLARMCANADAVGEALAEAGLGVRHPGRADHPQAALAARQMRHGGFVLGVDLGGAEAAARFREAAGLLDATSFGATHTSADRRARWGDTVPAGFLRVSCGIEPTEPLVASIRRGIAAL